MPAQDQLEDNKRFVRKFFATMDAKQFDEMEAMPHLEHLFHLPMARAPLDVKAHMEVNKHIQKSLPIVKRPARRGRPRGQSWATKLSAYRRVQWRGANQQDH
mgnify:CR=1 FL=1